MTYASSTRFHLLKILAFLQIAPLETRPLTHGHLWNVPDPLRSQKQNTGRKHHRVNHQSQPVLELNLRHLSSEKAITVVFDDTWSNLEYKLLNAVCFLLAFVYRKFLLSLRVPRALTYFDQELGYISQPTTPQL